MNMNLNQVTISVSNIECSILFYSKLGLQLIVKADHYCRFIVPGNEATFSIHKADKVSPGSTVVYFESDRLDEWVIELKNNDFSFSKEHADQRWLWREEYLKDPATHTIYFFFLCLN